MIKDNQKYFNRLHVLLDAFIVAGSYAFSWYFRFKIIPVLAEIFPILNRFFRYTVPASEIYFSAMVFVVPCYIILYFIFNLYTSKRMQRRKTEFYNIIKANLAGLVGFMVILYYIREEDFSRGLIFIFCGFNIIAETVFRNAVRYLLRNIRTKGFNLRHVLLVGYSRAAEEYIDRVNANPQWGYVIRGILDDTAERGNQYKGVKVIGCIEDLGIILPENKLDEIAITLSLLEYAKLEQIVNQCEKSGVHTKFIPDYNQVIPNRPYTEDLLGLPVINIRHVPLTNTFNMIVKRIIDLAGSLFLIVVTSPIMLLIAILVKMTSPGPLIYSQERVGLHNKPFKMYKFRSMEVQAPSEEKTKFTVPNDPRVTKVGKFIRKTSIDEFPQFFNVLFGDMSLVGPRPERPFFVEKFREEIPRYMVKHQVRPGITGWAQINGYRGNTSIRKRIEYDLYYIENWTLGFDFKILFLTIFKGFINKNAY
ncbi:undecaprenyl-phosphate glucose phosphotransferase [Konateibacter massiliensis]|uniref:undecaprenyl-phosphate glucose phosphotransferase n=1 Tax=Konateibacter massiliensis TaxID=2002841 RepID=UPI000C14766D|nr:undecaprenyl-phosphate glucose phosphotransferase [Konateibacter massiliensis]